MPADLTARGVRVKPLEWKEYPEQGFWRADTAIGEYSIGFDDGWWAQLEGVEFWEWEPPEDPRCYLGPEAGMNACRADYEARILAALELTALAEAPEVRALVREAAKAERDRIIAALNDEADLCPCAEDSVVIRDCARLVEVNFSYDEAAAAAHRKDEETPK